jgi:hypothetical protein
MKPSALAPLVLAAHAPLAAAQTYPLSELTALGPPAPAAGRAVDIDGDRAVFGADGSAWIAERTDDGRWKTVAELAQDLATGDSGYGSAVALDGDRAAVGAPGVAVGGQGDGIGVVFVFERQPDGAWEFVGVPTAWLGGVAPGFGTSLDLEGDALVVGAPRERDPATGLASGVVHVLERQANGFWLAVEALGAGTSTADAGLGTAVALSGDRILAGAPLDGEGGLAYLFEEGFLNGWTLADTLEGTKVTPGTEFGASVDVAGFLAIVGGPGYDDTLDDRGAAWAFRRTVSGAWTEEARLVVEDTGPDAEGGRSVRLGVGCALVGLPGRRSEDVPFSGAAALFRRNGFDDWSLSELVEPTTPGQDERFGAAVALDGGDLLIGAPGLDGANGRLEAFYAYAASSDPAPVAYGKGTPGCGDPLELSTNLPPLVASSDFQLLTTGAPVAGVGFGILAFAADIAGSDPLGQKVLLHVDLATVPPPLLLVGTSDAQGLGRIAAPIAADPSLAGARVFAQTVWGDPGCGPGPLGLTSSGALDITLGG